MDPFWIVELAAILLGLLLGSFLNVCIARVPNGESIVEPRSHCLSCGAPIRWYDNIPVLSWLLLRARCRDCGAEISWRYPAVELGVVLWFVTVIAIAWPVQPAALSAEALAANVLLILGNCILGFLLIGLIVMDWQTMLLPDVFTWPGIFLGFLLACIRAFFLSGNEDQVVLNTTHQLRLRSPGSFAAQGNVFLTGPEHLLGVWVLQTLGAALILLVTRWLYRAIRHREGMGLGDVKLIALIAAFLGFWPAILSLFLGAFLATLYAVPLLLGKRAGRATRLPFGSFLAAAGLIAALFGDRMLTAYTSFLR